MESIYDVVIGKDGKKHITQEWLDQISDTIALATWYMDDGCGRIGGRYPWFAMGVVTDNDVMTVRTWMMDRWSIHTNYRRDPSYYNNNTYAILTVSKESRNDFKRLIDPFIIPSMRYKIE